MPDVFHLSSCTGVHCTWCVGRPVSRCHEDCCQTPPSGRTAAANGLFPFCYKSSVIGNGSGVRASSFRSVCPVCVQVAEVWGAAPGGTPALCEGRTQ